MIDFGGGARGGGCTGQGCALNQCATAGGAPVGFSSLGEDGTALAANSLHNSESYRKGTARHQIEFRRGVPVHLRYAPSGSAGRN